MKLFGKASLVDRIEVPTQRKFTDSGQLIVPCAFARTGSMEYSAGTLGLQGKPADEVIKVFRDEEEVFSEDSMSSFRSAPLTIGHPRDEAGNPINVTAENSKELQVGFLEGMPARDEDFLKGTLVVARKDAIDMIEDGQVELSAGYTCDLMMDEDGNIYQRNIRANHIAIVAKGRAGASCRIADEAEEADTKVTVATLTDERDVALASVATLTDERDAALLQVSKLEAERDAALMQSSALRDELDASVESRVKTILVAKELCNMDEFSGKPVLVIKREVVADQMPDVKLEDKADAYVEAMFDILVDSRKGETSMSKLLRQESESQTTIVMDSKSSVDEARQKMINRHSRKA